MLNPRSTGSPLFLFVLLRAHEPEGERTSNIQHPTSNAERGCACASALRRWVFGVGCSVVVWEAATLRQSRSGPMNLRRCPSPVLRTPSPQSGEREGVRAVPGHAGGGLDARSFGRNLSRHDARQRRSRRQQKQPFSRPQKQQKQKRNPAQAIKIPADN